VLSASDEAFVMWVITCKYEQIKKRVAEGDIRKRPPPKPIGSKHSPKKKEDGSRATKPKGETDITSKLDNYKNFFDLVKNCRKNSTATKIWEKIFWDQFQYENQEDSVVFVKQESAPKIDLLPTFDDGDDEASPSKQNKDSDHDDKSSESDSTSTQDSKTGQKSRDTDGSPSDDSSAGSDTD